MKKLLFKVETSVGNHNKTTVNLWQANGELLHTRTLHNATRLAAFLQVVSEYLVENEIDTKRLMIAKSVSLKKTIPVWLKDN